MNKFKLLFISLNRNSYIINKSIINKLDKNSIDLKHILLIPSWADYYDNSDKLIVIYHDFISIIRLLTFSIIYRNKYSTIILPHYDIAILRAFILLLSNKRTKLVVVPDGVMFPSDINFINLRERRIKKFFLPLKFKFICYKVVNKVLEKIVVNRKFLYEKSWVFAFGEYFWVYYNLLNVKKNNFMSLGSPIFEDYLKKSHNVNNTRHFYTITFFFQPFIEENWISESFFNTAIVILHDILIEFNIKLIIKLHPSQDFNYYQNNFQKLGLINYQLEKIISNQELIEKSDFIFAYNTTVICDALILKKDVVIFNLFNFKRVNEYEEYLKLASVNSEIELKELIRNYYLNKYPLSKVSQELLNNFINLNVNSSFDIARFISKKEI